MAREKSGTDAEELAAELAPCRMPSRTAESGADDSVAPR